MYLVYTFLLYAALLLSLPWYLVKFRRYLPTLRDRLGYLRIPELKRSVWVHAVSVGEVKSVQKLIHRLRATHQGQPVVVSTITPTGQTLASGTAGLADYVFFFPIDIPGAIRRTLDRVNPALVVIAETEIWPNFLRECRKRGIRVVMVNGRISDRSYPRYRAIRRWLKHVLDDFALMGMQTETDRKRIEDIGADGRKVAVLGNLKYDVSAESRVAPELSQLLERFPRLWIAASTMPGEEELILDVFGRLRQDHPDLSLMLAPRHPERFDTVARMVDSRGLACSRRSAEPAEENTPQVLLLDSVGELASAFEYATVVYVGGSLVPRGGHNILEPAAFGKPVVFGRHMENFREIRDLFIESDAAVQVHDSEELLAVMTRLLSDVDFARSLGTRARRVVQENSGATERALAYLS